jgi:hypothetical protein
VLPSICMTVLVRWLVQGEQCHDGGEARER